LGERLGQSEIKLRLETESTTHTTFLALFLQSLDALGATDMCIMTSNDTHVKTLALLETIPHRVTVSIVKQGVVPAICNRQGQLAKKSVFEILEKPHGHGDVHALLEKSEIPRQWMAKGLNWLVFFQDSNPMAIKAITMSLGVCQRYKLDANIIAVPRLAKSAAGLLCVVNGQTINVEYNNVDKVLPGGDVNDPTTGFSVFPGNTNQLLFSLSTYCSVLDKTKGQVPEFVNPKYKTPDQFEKPTRLECLMQDILYSLPPESNVKVTLIRDAMAIVKQAHPVYAPSKNDRAGAKKLRLVGAADGSAISSELSLYASNFLVLRKLGVQFDIADCFTSLTVDATEFKVPPRIVLMPNALPVWERAGDMFPSPSKVKIAKGSVLVVRGPGKVRIEELDLKGTLFVEALDPAATIVLKKVRVSNVGGFALVSDSSRTKGFRPDWDASVRIIRVDTGDRVEVVDIMVD